LILKIAVDNRYNIPIIKYYVRIDTIININIVNATLTLDYTHLKTSKNGFSQKNSVFQVPSAKFRRLGRSPLRIAGLLASPIDGNRQMSLRTYYLLARPDHINQNDFIKTMIILVTISILTIKTSVSSFFLIVKNFQYDRKDFHSSKNSHDKKKLCENFLGQNRRSRVEGVAHYPE
jgi:hypothetical protein